MNNVMSKTIKSYWNVDLSGKFIGNNSDKLCIILPGIGYVLEKSYLDYSKQLAIQLNYDVLEIEYGYQVSRSTFNPEKEFHIMLKETFELIDSNIEKDYKEILIIGKSIGTCIQVLLNNHLKCKNITNIYLSPIDKTVELGITENSLVITGLADPLFTSESLSKLNTIKGINLVTIDNANHSLNIQGDVFKSIDTLKYVLEKIKNFIKSV